MKQLIRKPKELKIIGRADLIDLPDENIFNLPCKIDTGADSSAIHCDEIIIRNIDGKEHLIFKLLDKKHPLYNGLEICTSTFKEKRVKSSFGESADRFQVRLKVKIFNQKITTTFNLSSRPEMRYPVLLGRKFLKNRFLVNVAESNLSANNEVLIVKNTQRIK